MNVPPQYFDEPAREAWKNVTAKSIPDMPPESITIISVDNSSSSSLNVRRRLFDDSVSTTIVMSVKDIMELYGFGNAVKYATFVQGSIMDNYHNPETVIAFVDQAVSRGAKHFSTETKMNISSVTFTTVDVVYVLTGHPTFTPTAVYDEKSLLQTFFSNEKSLFVAVSTVIILLIISYCLCYYCCCASKLNEDDQESYFENEEYYVHKKDNSESEDSYDSYISSSSGGESHESDESDEWEYVLKKQRQYLRSNAMLEATWGSQAPFYGSNDSVHAQPKCPSSPFSTSGSSIPANDLMRKRRWMYQSFVFGEDKFNETIPPPSSNDSYYSQKSDKPLDHLNQKYSQSSFQPPTSVVDPSEWIEKYSERKQRPYWKNLTTHQSTWNNPFATYPPPRITPRITLGNDVHSISLATSDEWSKKYSPKVGKYYWKNSTSGKCTWKDPALPAGTLSVQPNPQSMHTAPRNLTKARSLSPSPQKEDGRRDVSASYSKFDRRMLI